MKGITCPKCDEYILLTKRKKELQALPATKIDLHKLISSIYDVQHMRIIFEGRFRATNETMYAKYVDRLFELEAFMKDHAEAQTKLYPVHEWIIAQKGLSYDLAGQLIGIIQDIKRFDNVSKLWYYSGLAVVDICEKCNRQWLPPEEKAMRILHIKERQKEQEAKKIVKTKQSEIIPAESMVCNCEHPVLIRKSQKPIKGTLLDYNPVAKSLAFKVASQFIKQGDFYRKLYEEFRDAYEARPDLKEEVDEKKGKPAKAKHGEVTETKGTLHIHRMAQRKMVKIFLQHLWVTWRELEGLPVTMPYAISVLGHGDYIKPPGPSAKEILEANKDIEPKLK